MPNRLADESSPYLLQHAGNPVDWFPWGEAAFEKARAEDKPLFVSIGYSTCHWCHVMERESFEDAEVADALNAAFVPVKVDREERPDVDSLYMTACQLMRKQGGWPLNVLLTPDGKPFHAETYLPKTGRFGRMGLLELTERVQQLWQNERAKITESADGLTDALRQMSAPQAAEAALDENALHAAYSTLRGRFDAAHGGFGSAPKFPAPHNLLFLLRYGRLTGETRATEMVEQTLDAMRRGGVFDQLGYGFHRYSTDERWLLPHFEKMLYDQAMLAMAYTEAYQATGHARHRRTAEEVFEYVFRDLTSKDDSAAGAFFSAEDADSEGAEGTFYVWRTEEVRDVLGEEDADRFIEAFGLEEEGNFREEASGEKTGANVLHLKRTLEEQAAASDLDDAAFRERIETARQKLLDRRAERPRPHRDDKVLTDWNGLMIAALAKAARAFDTPRYAEAAERAASFLLGAMRDDEGRLLHRYREGDAGIPAHLDDYAFFAWGLTELYEATFETRWLRAAVDLADEMHARCADEEAGGYFLSATDGEPLLARQKPFQDAAMPSGNAGALLATLRLARLTGRTDFAERADRLLEAAAAQVRQQPSGATALLCGLALAVGPSREVVVSGDPASEATQALLDVLRSRYTPEAVTLLRPPGGDPEITALAPFTKDQLPVDGQAAAYVCENHACRQPVTTPSDLEAALRT